MCASADIYIAKDDPARQCLFINQFLQEIAEFDRV
jgi:hypothetical protein